ncbi:caspase family protein [Streptomyces sp. NPDC054833]
MGRIKALLVGVDNYPESVATPLGGCANDIAAAHRLLTDLVGERADVMVLLDDDATVDALTDAVVRHLGAAGDGDTALLWFSGHGTQREATGDDLLIEATGLNQALVCVDGPLLDKRLGALLDTVAAGGAQVVAVLDCCHSGGATREDAWTARYAPPSPTWDLEAADVPAPRAVPRHVLLAASRLDQQSFEGWFDGVRQGAFTQALVGATRAAGADASCRELLATAAARVRRSGSLQQPVLFPDLPGGAADRPLLGEATDRTPSAHLLRYGPDGWEVDCGAAHGLRDDAVGARGTEFTVVDAGPDRPVVRAREVRVDRTLVTPLDRVPDPERVHPVTLSAVALPPGTVALDGSAAATRELTEALSTAPLLRLVDGPEDAGDLHFRVEVRGGAALVLRRDGTEFTAPLPYSGGVADARRVVDCLAHLTRWHQLRDLTPRPSPLDGLVRLEITPWGSDEPLRRDAAGEIVCPYTDGQAPWISVRLRNSSPDRTLWCLLLDLTDSYASHSVLYPGHFIGPGRTGYALDGEPVQLSLPPTRSVAPGAEGRDWLKLIVAEGELSTLSYQLPAWEPWVASGARDLGPAIKGGPGRWTAVTLPLRTLVP